MKVWTDIMDQMFEMKQKTSQRKQYWTNKFIYTFIFDDLELTHILLCHKVKMSHCNRFPHELEMVV